MPNTIHCGYCNTERTPDVPCTCLEQQRAFQARRKETDAWYAVKRSGIAQQDAGYKRPLGRG